MCQMRQIIHYAINVQLLSGLKMQRSALDSCFMRFVCATGTNFQIDTKNNNISNV